MTYRHRKMLPVSRLSTNLPKYRVTHKLMTAMRSEPTMNSMPEELMYTTASAPWESSVRVLMSHGMPRANRMASELAPSAFDTPIPPSPETKHNVTSIAFQF